MHRKKLKRYDIPCNAHHLTFSCFKLQPFLKDDSICRALADVIIKSKEKYGFHLWAYVFMPEHVHLLIWPTETDYSTSLFLKSIKGPVSRKVIGHVRNNKPDKLHLFESGQKKEAYHFWIPGGGYDRNLTSVRDLIIKVEYIHGNPVRRGLVDNPLDWKWSSAREWFEPGSGPVQIDRDSFPVV